MKKVAVIGCGAAGMMAAIHAAKAGADVTVLEKNEKAGKKMYITGKGRCNVTNVSDEFFSYVFRNPRFLYASLACLDSAKLTAMLEERVALKTERGGRVFPVSDKSSDIIRAMTDEMRDNGIRVRFGEKVTGITTKDGSVTGLLLESGEKLSCDSVILATGGKSYPLTGSTGDGYAFSEELGHKVTPLFPALVPIETKETWPAEIMGLSLKNCCVTGKANSAKKPFFSETGEMLFTHFGLSGPLILKLASMIPEKQLLRENGRTIVKDITVSIDLKPALDEAELDQRLVRDIAEKQRGRMPGYMDGLVPHNLGLVILRLCGINEKRTVDSLTKEERHLILEKLKCLTLTAKGLRGFEEAIITRGGVSVKEVDPSTMQSKIVKGLYFAGELLDVDAATGGFNLQIAFSTGALAGRHAAE